MKLSEKQIQNKIIRKFATRSDMRLFRANTGKGVPLSFVRKALSVLIKGDVQGAIRLLNSPPVVSYGVPGMADLSGIKDGIRIEVECKTDIGRQSKEQIVWQNMIENMGGIYILARSVEDVEEGLK